MKNWRAFTLSFWCKYQCSGIGGGFVFATHTPNAFALVESAFAEYETEKSTKKALPFTREGLLLIEYKKAPTYSHTCYGNTIGSGGLNCSVRNGKR